MVLTWYIILHIVSILLLNCWYVKQFGRAVSGFPTGWRSLRPFSLRRCRVWKNTFGTAVVEWSNGSTKKRITPRLPRVGGCTLRTRWLVKTRILTRMNPGKNMACWNGRLVAKDCSVGIYLHRVCCAKGFQLFCWNKIRSRGFAQGLKLGMNS